VPTIISSSKGGRISVAAPMAELILLSHPTHPGVYTDPLRALMKQLDYSLLSGGCWPRLRAGVSAAVVTMCRDLSEADVSGK
jgi:hypothetical protein